MRPIREGLFTWPAERPELLGSRCTDCGEVTFPAQADCRRCGGRDCRVEPIGHRGTLWSWTVQRFLPKPPYASGETEETFRPYGVGYVELPSGVKVEARLTENRPERLVIGMPMRLVVAPFRTDPESGEVILGFYFAPEEDEEEAA
ncbi:MAG: hypothetical protein KatS3mg124_1707 [Porticoccaceae bacterium]|nr:MAG: hypothetical protein KatS3mg124_1707 [Porticoccaceae bacterium]